MQICQEKSVGWSECGLQELVLARSSTTKPWRQRRCVKLKPWQQWCRVRKCRTTSICCVTQRAWHTLRRRNARWWQSKAADKCTSKSFPHHVHCTSTWPGFMWGPGKLAKSSDSSLKSVRIPRFNYLLETNNKTYKPLVSLKRILLSYFILKILIFRFIVLFAVKILQFVDSAAQKRSARPSHKTRPSIHFLNFHMTNGGEIGDLFHLNHL